MDNKPDSLQFFENFYADKFHRLGRLLYLVVQFREACVRYRLVMLLYFLSLGCFFAYTAYLLHLSSPGVVGYIIFVLFFQVAFIAMFSATIYAGFILSRRFSMKVYIGIRDASVFFLPLSIFIFSFISGGLLNFYVLAGAVIFSEICLATYYERVIAPKKQKDLDIAKTSDVDEPVDILLTEGTIFQKRQVNGDTRNVLIAERGKRCEFKLNKKGAAFKLAVGIKESPENIKTPVSLSVYVRDSFLTEPVLMVKKTINLLKNHEERNWLEFEILPNWDKIDFGSHLFYVSTDASVYLSEPRSAKTSERPRKIIFVIFDAVRHDHIGSYGYDKATSPNLDAFSKEAALFKNAMVQGEWTLTSFMSFLTGLYPSSHGVFHPTLYQHLDPSITTLPAVLRDNGFITKCYFTHKRLVSNFGFARGFDSHIFRQCDKEHKIANGDDVLSYGIDMLDFHKKDELFLMLHFFDTHQPCYPPPPYTDFFDKTYPAEVIKDVRNYLMSNRKRRINQRDVENLIARYDAEISRLDKRFGALVGYLKLTGQYDDAMIIFTADHGMLLNDHNDLVTIKLFDETISVPLIIKFPKGLGYNNGLVKGDYFSQANIDIMPTILETFNIDKPKQSQGKSLAALCRNDNNTCDRCRFAISESFFADTYTVSVRSADHRYLAEIAFNPLQPFEKIIVSIKKEALYKIENDKSPAEVLIEKETSTIKSYRDIAMEHVAKSKIDLQKLKENKNLGES